MDWKKQILRTVFLLVMAGELNPAHGQQAPVLRFEKQTNNLNLIVGGLTNSGAAFVYSGADVTTLASNATTVLKVDAPSSDIVLPAVSDGTSAGQGFFVGEFWPGRSITEFGDPENADPLTAPDLLLFTSDLPPNLGAGQPFVVDFVVTDPTGQPSSISGATTISVVRETDSVIHPDAVVTPSTWQMTNGFLRATIVVTATSPVDGYTLALTISAGTSAAPRSPAINKFIKAAFGLGPAPLTQPQVTDYLQKLEQRRQDNADNAAGWADPMPNFGWHVSGTFGEWRGDNNTRCHYGVDLGTSGTTAVEIDASRGGVVSMVGLASRDGSIGHQVVIDHGMGKFSCYLHLKQSSIVVTQGQAIVRGAVIATNLYSRSGWGPHLHFEIRTNAAAAWGIGKPGGEDPSRDPIGKGTAQDPLVTPGIFSVAAKTKRATLENFAVTRTNPGDFAIDMDANPAFGSGSVYFAAQMFDPESGHLGLRTISFAPEGMTVSEIHPTNNINIATYLPRNADQTTNGFARYLNPLNPDNRNYFRYWWKWDTFSYTNNKVGKRSFSMTGQDYSGASTNYNLTFGPFVKAVTVINTNQFKFTIVAHLGTNTPFQPDQYNLQVVQPDGQVQSNVVWKGALDAKDSNSTVLLTDHLSEWAFTNTLSVGVLTQGMKLRVSSRLVPDIAHELDIIPTLVIMARTGQDNITSINGNAAINAEGMVAFTGVDTTGSRPFAVQTNHNIIRLGIVGSGRTFDGVGISSGPSPQVLARELVSGPSYIVRAWDVNTGVGTILGSSVNSSAPADFDSASVNVDFNKQAVAAAAALIGGSTATALLIGSVRPMTQAAVYSGVFGLRPQIADNGEAVIRDNIGRIVVLNQSGPTFIAASSGSGFGSDTGNKPGIAADGSVVAFSGNRGAGSGIYVCLRAPVFTAALFPIAGGELADGFSGFVSEQRVGVRAVQNGSSDLITVVFQGASNGVAGVFTRDVTVSAGVVQPLAPVQAIIKNGDSFGGATVTGYTLYRPINDAGQLAFTMQLSDGTSVVVRR